MPWCDTCDRFLSPSTVRADGTCPACGRAVDPGRAHAATPEELAALEVARHPVDAEPADSEAPTTRAVEPTPAKEPVLNIYGEPIDVDDDQKLPLPWHLKLLAGALAVYLGYRFLQGIEWVFGK